MIVRRLAIPGAWLAGFVFALHPVCVECGGVDFGAKEHAVRRVFYLGAALAYLHFDRTPPAEIPIRLRTGHCSFWRC